MGDSIIERTADKARPLVAAKYARMGRVRFAWARFTTAVEGYLGVYGALAMFPLAVFVDWKFLLMAPVLWFIGMAAGSASILLEEEVQRRSGGAG